MAAEYTFYRAEGMSLSAVETAEEARLEWHREIRKLEKRFGACAVGFSKDEATGRLKFDCFAFDRDDKTPDGWNIQPAGDGQGSLATGMPKPGTPDDFYLASVAGLLDRTSKNMKVENLLGVAEMPRKQLPAGEYHGEFVRDNSLKTPGGKPVGRMRDKVTLCFRSNGAMSAYDPVDYLKLDGAWYLRVPNKPGTEETQFAPQDAVRMDYSRMLELDKAEQELRYGRPAPPFRPGGGAFC